MKKTIAVIMTVIVFSGMVFAKGNGNGKGMKNGSGINQTTSGTSLDYSVNGNSGKSKKNNGNGNGEKVQDKVKRQERLFFNDKEIQEASVKKYDVDGDGKLSSSEYKSMSEDRANLRKACDTDGDGKLSDAEYEVFRQSLIDELGL